MYNFEYTIGSKIHNWTVMSDVFRNKWNKKSIICKCTCGTIQNHELSKISFTKWCRKCYIKSKEKSKEKISEYRRFWGTKKKYNVDKEVFLKMWEHQKGKCAICENDMIMTQATKGQSLDTVSIDHNHKTKRTRGLLCNRCNKGIGSLRENVEILEKAIKYLNKHEKISFNPVN
ncbi:MAG: endonuclease VII domain-containing protein [Bacteroidota bacterium]